MTDPEPPAAPDRAAVAAIWSEYRAASGATGDPVDVFAFGLTVEQADGLGELVLHGPKRATAGLVADFEAEGTPLPQVGDHTVFVLGDRAARWRAADHRHPDRAAVQRGRPVRLGRG